MYIIVKNPSCKEIEELNHAIANELEDSTIVLSLARHTNVNFFAQTWIAQLLSHLAQRKGKLIIRDAYHRWTPKCEERFTANIDGVAALVYSNIASEGLLKNATNIEAPITIYNALINKLKITSRLEDSGQTRTFIAIDPEYSMPIDFPSSRIAWQFQRIVQNILTGFNYQQKSGRVKEVEKTLYKFIYEVYLNSIEHGRYSKDGQLTPGLRYLRIRTYIDSNIDKLRFRAKGFPELGKFISSHKSNNKSTLRFMELSVSDAGQGIVSHYINSRAGLSKKNYDREDLLYQLIGSNISSKDKISGVGLGLPNAMEALFELNAFISLRTEEFWMYRDFLDENELGHPNIIFPVSNIDHITYMRGTQFNVLICISN